MVDFRTNRVGIFQILLFTSCIYFSDLQVLSLCTDKNDGDPCLLSCKTLDVNQVISISKSPSYSAVGSCLVGGTCFSADQLRYNISQSDPYTNLEIFAFDKSDNATWRCEYAGNPTFDIFMSWSKLPTSITELSGLTSNVTITNDLTISVEVGCLYSLKDPTTNLQLMCVGALVTTYAMSCIQSTTVCSDSDLSAYICNYTITSNPPSQTCNSGKTGYSLKAVVSFDDTTKIYDKNIFVLYTVSFESQGTGSCDCKYWNCIGIILAVVSFVSLVCTVMLIWKRKQIKLKAKFIICFCEKIKWTYCCGTSVLILVAVLIILTIITLAIWLIAMLIVIFTCCASEECNVRGIVAGISFVLSLVVILICEVVFWIICCFIDRGCIHVKVESGDKITLLEGLTPPAIIFKVQWTHEGNILPSGNSVGGTIECPSLTLNTVSLNQSGEYVCIITCGSEGETEQKVYQLRLLVTPKKYEVKIGQNVKLLKSLKNLQDVKWVKWTHRNKIITKSCFYTVGDNSNPILTVNCFATSDSGLYYCRVQTAQVESPNVFSAHLKIKDQKQVNSGESIVLLKKLERSDDVTSVVWTHNKKALVSESNCIYEGGNIACPALTIPVVSPKNAGKYECKIESNQGDFKMYRVFLEVNVPKIKAKVGNEVTLLQNLSCPHKIDGVEWYINGTKAGIDEVKYHGGFNDSPPLKVGCLRMGDTGRYTCDLIISELHIKLHIPVDLEVEEEENARRPLPPVRTSRTSRVNPEV